MFKLNKMSSPVLKLFISDKHFVQITLVRNLRGKPPGVAKSLKQRLEGKLNLP
jgi:hypothetical protein